MWSRSGLMVCGGLRLWMKMVGVLGKEEKMFWPCRGLGRKCDHLHEHAVSIYYDGLIGHVGASLANLVQTRECIEDGLRLEKSRFTKSILNIHQTSREGQRRGILQLEEWERWEGSPRGSLLQPLDITNHMLRCTAACILHTLPPPPPQNQQQYSTNYAGTNQHQQNRR